MYQIKLQGTKSVDVQSRQTLIEAALCASNWIAHEDGNTATIMDGQKSITLDFVDLKEGFRAMNSKISATFPLKGKTFPVLFYPLEPKMKRENF